MSKLSLHPSSAVRPTFLRDSVADSSALLLNNLKVCLLSGMASEPIRSLIISLSECQFRPVQRVATEAVQSCVAIPPAYLSPMTSKTSYTATDGQPNAGLSYLRVPLGASDFSASGQLFVSSPSRNHVFCMSKSDWTFWCPVYSLDDQKGDTSLAAFNVNRAPSYLFSVINDIRAINPYLKVHVLPWSPVR